MIMNSSEIFAIKQYLLLNKINYKKNFNFHCHITQDTISWYTGDSVPLVPRGVDSFQVVKTNVDNNNSVS